MEYRNKKRLEGIGCSSWNEHSSRRGFLQNMRNTNSILLAFSSRLAVPMIHQHGVSCLSPSNSPDLDFSQVFHVASIRLLRNYQRRTTYAAVAKIRLTLSCRLCCVEIRGLSAKLSRHEFMPLSDLIIPRYHSPG